MFLEAGRPPYRPFPPTRPTRTSTTNRKIGTRFNQIKSATQDHTRTILISRSPVAPHLPSHLFKPPPLPSLLTFFLLPPSSPSRCLARGGEAPITTSSPG